MARELRPRENPAAMGADAARTDEESRIATLRRLLDPRGIGRTRRSLAEAELLELFRLYRYSSSLLARLRTRSGSASGVPATSRRGNDSVRSSRARTALVHRDLGVDRRGFAERAIAFLLDEVPRAIRSEWKVVGAAFALVYGLAIVLVPRPSVATSMSPGR
jgi:hypothetical protein